MGVNRDGDDEMPRRELLSTSYSSFYEHGERALYAGARLRQPVSPLTRSSDDSYGRAGRAHRNRHSRSVLEGGTPRVSEVINARRSQRLRERLARGGALAKRPDIWPTVTRAVQAAVTIIIGANGDFRAECRCR